MYVSHLSRLFGVPRATVTFLPSNEYRTPDLVSNTLSHSQAKQQQ
jgi:hypothetical protein